MTIKDFIGTDKVQLRVSLVDHAVGINSLLAIELVGVPANVAVFVDSLRALSQDSIRTFLAPILGFHFGEAQMMGPGRTGFEIIINIPFDRLAAKADRIGGKGETYQKDDVGTVEVVGVTEYDRHRIYGTAAVEAELELRLAA